jgi:hypothetical protein
MGIRPEQGFAGSARPAQGCEQTLAFEGYGLQPVRTRL